MSGNAKGSEAPAAGNPSPEVTFAEATNRLLSVVKTMEYWWAQQEAAWKEEKATLAASEAAAGDHRSRQEAALRSAAERQEAVLEVNRQLVAEAAKQSHALESIAENLAIWIERSRP